MKITRPVLLLDEKKCRANIVRMAEKAKAAGIILRPHFKTHQSQTIGEWFREAGVTHCTCSSVQMASYFAAAGWKSITVAFPLNALEASEINRLAKDIQLNVLAVAPDEILLLIPQLKYPLGCFIEIDSGGHRTGIQPKDFSAIDKTLDAISSSPLISFKGFLTHAGFSYGSKSTDEILQIHKETNRLMKETGDHYRSRFPELVVSVGDTPTCSLATDFSAVQEIRPGNYVFFDWMQRKINTCRTEDVAIAMACPVVAVYPERKEVIVHGGAVHFSKDFIKNEDGSPNYGQVVKWNGESWGSSTGMYLKGMSQEHGVLHAGAEDIKSCKPGDVITILPIHSCLTADVMGGYTTLDGRRVGMMPKGE